MNLREEQDYKTWLEVVSFAAELHDLAKKLYIQNYLSSELEHADKLKKAFNDAQSFVEWSRYKRKRIIEDLDKIDLPKERHQELINILNLYPNE